MSVGSTHHLEVVFVWKQNYILVDEYFFFCCTWIVNSARKGNVFEGIADYNSKTPRVRANYIFKFMERYNRRLQRNGKMMQLNAWTGLDRVKQNPPEVTGKLANNSHQQSWQSYR